MRPRALPMACLLVVALLVACSSPTTEVEQPSPTAVAAALPSGTTSAFASSTPASVSPTSTLAPVPTTPEPLSTPVPVLATPSGVAGSAACQGQLIFLRGGKLHYALYTVRADGSELVRLVADVGDVHDLSVSPDGTRLLYTSYRDRVYGVYTVDWHGREQPLGFSPAANPSWSADGQSVLVVSQTGYRTGLYLVDLDGGEPRSLTDTASHKTGPAWSPDGAWIAYTMLDSYNQGEVWLMPAPGQPAGPGSVNLTQHPAHDCCVAWSPDSTRLAFLSSRADEGARPAQSGAFATYGWTEALVRVAYEAGRPVLLAAPRPLTTVSSQPPVDIYLLGRDGSGLFNLTTGAGRERDPAWSPDGRRLAYVSDRDGNDEIYVVNADGSGALRLTRNGDRDFSPRWSPDGTCLAFVSYRQDAYGIYLLPMPAEPGAEPGEPWKLVDGGTGSGGLDWIP